VESAIDFAKTCASELRMCDVDTLLVRIADVGRQPTNPMPLYQLGTLARENGRVDLWYRAAAIALSLEHVTCEQVYARAIAKGLLGDPTAWTDFEARLFNPRWGFSRSKLNWTHSMWNGKKDLVSQTLLIRRQGGFGDAILMFRFLERLKLQVGRIVLDVKPELVDLSLHNFASVAEVVSVDSDVSANIDYFVWAMSLPHIVGELPSFKPITAPDPLPALAGQDRARLHIGLCWACKGATLYEHEQRSIPLAQMASLFDVNELKWYSLQIGPGASDADEHPNLIKPLLCAGSFGSTANFLASLDCVVTVDTAIFHLSASMGIPTFVLLPYASDWKWGLGNHTPWYPSARLIRQTEPGNWWSAILQLAPLLADRDLARHLQHLRES
jgi:hypothetical protein